MVNVPNVDASYEAKTDTNKTDAKAFRMLQNIVAASLAGGMIAASGRPHTPQEALNLFRTLHNALYPSPNNSHYKEWAKDRDAHMRTVHS